MNERYVHMVLKLKGNRISRKTVDLCLMGNMSVLSILKHLPIFNC